MSAHPVIMALALLLLGITVSGDVDARPAGGHGYRGGGATRSGGSQSDGVDHGGSSRSGGPSYRSSGGSDRPGDVAPRPPTPRGDLFRTETKASRIVTWSADRPVFGPIEPAPTPWPASTRTSIVTPVQIVNIIFSLVVVVGGVFGVWRYLTGQPKNPGWSTGPDFPRLDA